MNANASFDIEALKNNVDLRASLTLPIRGARGEVIGRLVCVDRARAGDATLHSDLTAWRRRYMKYFLTQFEATPSRTAAWLRDAVLPGATRILFMIESDVGASVGHLGVSKIEATSAELDNLVRGRKGGDARLIYFAELSVLQWLFRELGKDTVTLHVLSTNRVTVALHESVGFRLHARKRLSKLGSHPDTRYLVDSADGEPMEFTYNEMRLSRVDFELQHSNRQHEGLP